MPYFAFPLALVVLALIFSAWVNARPADEIERRVRRPPLRPERVRQDVREHAVPPDGQQQHRTRARADDRPEGAPTWNGDDSQGESPDVEHRLEPRRHRQQDTETQREQSWPRREQLVDHQQK